MNLTTEWTEACRSGSCSLCHEGDEVLWIQIEKSEWNHGLRFCYDCAAGLVTILRHRGIEGLNED